MQIFKKEKQVVELALKHAGKTGECLGIMASAVKAFSTSELANLENATSDVDRLESEADGVLREIRELLYSGAYLPTIRGDLYRLLSAVDSVTNRIEGCIDFVNAQRPEAASSFHVEIGELLDLTVECFAQLRLALDAFFKPKGEVGELRVNARKVGEFESAIDDRELTLTRKVFDTDMPLAEKQHVAQLVSRIARISDQVENAADELELLSLKSII